MANEPIDPIDKLRFHLEARRRDLYTPAHNGDAAAVAVRDELHALLGEVGRLKSEVANRQPPQAKLSPEEIDRRFDRTQADAKRLEEWRLNPNGITVESLMRWARADEQKRFLQEMSARLLDDGDPAAGEDVTGPEIIAVIEPAGALSEREQIALAEGLLAVVRSVARKKAAVKEMDRVCSWMEERALTIDSAKTRLAITPKLEFGMRAAAYVLRSAASDIRAGASPDVTNYDVHSRVSPDGAAT